LSRTVCGVLDQVDLDQVDPNKAFKVRPKDGSILETIQTESTREDSAEKRGPRAARARHRQGQALVWFACMRSRKTPNGSIETGFAHSIAVIMATRSYREGKKM
jgi:hypothetical protein